MFVVYLLTERKIDAVLLLFKTRKDTLLTIGFTCMILCLFGVLFYPYYLRSLDTNAYPSILEIEHSQPHLWNYFFTTDRSVLWGWSNSFIATHFVEEKFLKRENYIFIGMLPYIFSIAAFCMFRKDATIRFFLITACAVVILTLFIFNFSIYKYVVSILPGALSIRVVSRYIVVAVCIWSILSTLFLDKILSLPNGYITLFMLFLPVLLVLDNSCIPAKEGILKSTCQERSKLMVEKYEHAKHTNPFAKAFMYCFNADSIRDNHKKISTAIFTQMDVVMASQVIGVPCVNGYSAKPPPDYRDCFMSPNEKNSVPGCIQNVCGLL